MTTEPQFYSTDVDDEPGKYGLEVLGEVGTHRTYDYDFTRAWVDAAGALYVRRTSGCSCGHPFDEMSSLSDLIPVDAGTIPWLAALKEDDELRPYDVNEAEWTTFVAMLRLQLLDSSTKRFDVEAYKEAVHKREAEEAEKAALYRRRVRIRKAMMTVGARTGIPLPYPEMVPSNYELFDFVHEAEKFTASQVLILGATLHAMAFEQLQEEIKQGSERSGNQESSCAQ